MCSRPLAMGLSTPRLIPVVPVGSLGRWWWSPQLHFKGGFKFLVTTRFWINWPKPRTASLPLAIRVHLTEIAGAVSGQGTLGARGSQSREIGGGLRHAVPPLPLQRQEKKNEGVESAVVASSCCALRGSGHHSAAILIEGCRSCLLQVRFGVSRQRSFLAFLGEPFSAFEVNSSLGKHDSKHHNLRRLDAVKINLP